MERLSTVRSRVLRATIVSAAFVAAGPAAGMGSPGADRTTTATGCKPSVGEVVTLRLSSAPGGLVRADVGDTIKVIAHVPGGRVHRPEPFDHKHAVCRISMRRVSKGEVIAKFRARRALKEKIRFGASGVTSSKGCARGSHGCPRPVLMIGYVKISSARSVSKGHAPRFTG
jgi:hypothetical protein